MGVIDYVYRAEVKVATSKSPLSDVEDTNRRVDAFSCIDEPVSEVPNLEIRVFIFLSPFLLLDVDYGEGISIRSTFDTYMDSVLVLLLYVFDIQRSSNKLGGIISDDNTLSGVAGENSTTHHRITISRYTFASGPEGGDDFGLSVPDDPLEETEFIAGISDSSPVERPSW